jgi:L-ribulose-5-phosphate 3-epimerase
MPGSDFCNIQRRLSRRGFLVGLGSLAVASAFATSTVSLKPSARVKSCFKLSVLTDEITQDFGRACEIVANEFGLGWVDLRALWGKNIVDLDEQRIAEAKSLLKQFNLRVGCIAGPLFKTSFRSAPTSDFAPKGEKADEAFDRQDKVLERELELAKVFEAGSVRCFDFWRLKDPKPFRAQMDEKLKQAAEACRKQDLILLLENEHACNTATAAESVRTLEAVQAANFKLIWDPGNAFFAGEKPFPDGYDLLPKERIGLVHCKDARRKSEGKSEFAAMGGGVIDYVGQFRALKRDGFAGLVTLETHWTGAGSKEESTRQSWAGMKKQLSEAGALG